MKKQSTGRKDPIVQHWLTEIESAKKREEDFRKDGKDILEIYGSTKSTPTPFNILFSNTETMLPNLYSSVPIPVVERRFKDDDQLGKAAARAGQLALKFLLDTNVEGYETFDDGMSAVVLDALLPGRGVTCIKYDAKIGELPPQSDSAAQPAVVEGLEGSAAAPVAQAGSQPATTAAEPDPYKESELVCLDSKEWNKVYFGFAKKWSKVPWIAYEEYIDKEEARRLFGEKAEKMVFTEHEEDEEKEKTEDESKRKTACIYVIWDRDGGKKIRYISAQYKDGYLKVDDDPLQLTGFFNCPKPLQFVKKNDLLPTALYTQYKEQAEEINSLTRRIAKITKAIKARGAYDSQLGADLEKIMEGDDNELVPAESASSLAAEKGLDAAIWFMPIDKLIIVLRELMAAREAAKQVVYEIMGIADIMRGQSNASETLGAQEIKQHFGTLRLKRLQKEVQRYARDILRMMLEIAATQFNEDTWKRMTGLPFLTTQESAQLQAVAQAAQQTGQPPDQQTQQKLQQPTWEQVLSVLKDDMQRSYRIDIETNTTVEAEATEDKKDVTEFMTAMGQLMNGLTPLVEKGVLPFQGAQAMMLAVSRRFRFGSEIEDYLKSMQPPKPEDDGKGADAEKKVMAAEAKAMQAEMDKKAMADQQSLNEKKTQQDIREIKLNAQEEIFRIEQAAAKREQACAQKEQQVNLKDQQRTIEFAKKEAQAQNGKFKTENVVNKKADDTLGKGVASMEKTVQGLAQMVQQLVQKDDMQDQRIERLVQAVTAPRKRTPVRGPDGRIGQVIDEPA